MDIAELTGAIRHQFYLVGEDVFRSRDGKKVKAGGSRRSGYPQVWVYLPKKHLIGLHRVKFCLVNGYVPSRVDHKNRDVRDLSGANLRAATHSQNIANSSSIATARSGLPRGVRRRPSGRFQAYVVDGGKQKSLGTFASCGEAEIASKRARLERYGEFVAW